MGKYQAGPDQAGYCCGPICRMFCPAEAIPRSEPQAPLHLLDNQRAAQRQRVLKSGIIAFNSEAIHFVARNIFPKRVRRSTWKVQWYPIGIQSASVGNLHPPSTSAVAWSGVRSDESASPSNDACALHSEGRLTRKAAQAVGRRPYQDELRVLTDAETTHRLWRRVIQPAAAATYAAACEDPR